MSGNRPRCMVKTVEEFPFYEMIGGWRQLKVEDLEWLPSRSSIEFRFSLPKTIKLSDATDRFYKALHSVTNHYNTRLFSNLLQFPDIDNFEAQFFCYSSSIESNETLEVSLKNLKRKHLDLEDNMDVNVDNICNIAVVLPPPDYSKEDLQEFLVTTPFNTKIVPFLSLDWKEIKERALQLLRERLNYYSSSFINKHFDNVEQDRYQEMLRLAVDKIPVEQGTLTISIFSHNVGWFMLHNMEHYDITSARQYQNMWFIDHLERYYYILSSTPKSYRNWVALFRAAQIFTAQCKLYEKELVHGIVKSHAERPKNTKKQRKKRHSVEDVCESECLQCFSHRATVVLEPCKHCYFCNKCWENYQSHFFLWTNRFNCFVCGQKVEM
jgi:hypothetical protein